MAFRILESCTGCTACLNVCPTQAITGERKRLHVIDPEVCIECGACGLICPAAAVLDGSSRLCSLVRRSLWPKPVVLEEKCVSCNACLQACPVTVLDGKAAGALSPVHLIPYLKDEKNCIGCALCEQTCPVLAIRMRTPQNPEPQPLDLHIKR